MRRSPTTAGAVIRPGWYWTPLAWTIARALATAARVGYSETAFVEAAGDDGRYLLRYFSPQSEVAFCGHATIATAVAMAERHGPGVLHFDTSPARWRCGPARARPGGPRR